VRPLVHIRTGLREGQDAVSEDKQDRHPPPVCPAPPDRELEQRLKRDPSNLDKKADVGSDESMDASDPPASSQPGQSDDPVPSSSFPE
jgi:hypothetical protein